MILQLWPSQVESNLTFAPLISFVGREKLAKVSVNSAARLTAAAAAAAVASATRGTWSKLLFAD